MQKTVARSVAVFEVSAKNLREDVQTTPGTAQIGTDEMQGDGEFAAELETEEG